MNRISRTAALSVGALVTAATVATGAGVASAATTPHAKTPATRLAHVVARQTAAAHRLDRAVARVDARTVRWSTRIGKLPDGTAKTDALGKLADIKTQTAAISADDAKVLAALKTVSLSDPTTTRAVLRADRTTLKDARSHLRTVRKDGLAVRGNFKK